MSSSWPSGPSQYTWGHFDFAPGPLTFSLLLYAHVWTKLKATEWHKSEAGFSVGVPLREYMRQHSYRPASAFLCDAIPQRQ